MPKILKYLICLAISVGSISLAKAGNPRLNNLLEQLKSKKQVLQSVPETTPQVKPEVTIHFLWASWCEYCGKAYEQLNAMKIDKKSEGKITVIGYDLDDQVNSAVKEKLKEMPAISQFHVSPKAVQIPDEMKRLPAIIIENLKTHELDAYTGFTNERFHYMKKQVMRIVTNASEDENAQ